MAVTLESNTEPMEEMRDALIVNGLTVREEAKPAEPAKPAADEKKTPETTEAPGEKIPVETVVEATPATGAVEEKTQEPTQEEKEKKSKGGFQAKVEKLTRKAEMLEEALESERGSKTALQRKLDEVNTELAALKPAPKEDAGPVRPKRPTLKDFDFDQDKFDAANEKYDDELDQYHAAMAEKKTSDAIAKFAAESQQNQAMAAYRARIVEDAKDLPDYDDLIARLPEELVAIPLGVERYITTKSKHPAKLMHLLMKDYLDDDGEVMNRLGQLDEIDQVLEIREIERDLVGKAKATAEPKKETPKPEPVPAKPAEAATPKTEAAPVKPKPKTETLDAPIEPVGSRAAAAPESMEQLAERAAGGDREAQKLLSQRVREVQTVKHGGRV